MWSLICAFSLLKTRFIRQSSIMGTEYKNIRGPYFSTVDKTSSIINMFKEIENS